MHGHIQWPGHRKGCQVSNQSDAREKAYNDYVAVAASNVPKKDKDTAWSAYLVALAADPGAQQAPKKH